MFCTVYNWACGSSSPTLSVEDNKLEDFSSVEDNKLEEGFVEDNKLEEGLLLKIINWKRGLLLKILEL